MQLVPSPLMGPSMWADATLFKFCLVLAPILCPTGYLNILEHYEMYYGLFMTCLSKIRLKGFVLCVDFYLYIFV